MFGSAFVSILLFVFNKKAFHPNFFYFHLIDYMFFLLLWFLFLFLHTQVLTSHWLNTYYGMWKAPFIQSLEKKNWASDLILLLAFSIFTCSQIKKMGYVKSEYLKTAKIRILGFTYFLTKYFLSRGACRSELYTWFIHDYTCRKESQLYFNWT